MTPLHTSTLSLEQYLALNLHPVALGALCILLPVLLSCLGLVVVRRIVPSDFLQLHHDITGPFFNTMGAVYGIFLALIVANTWQSYASTDDNIVQEARCLGSLYSDAEAFPAPFREEVRQLITGYRDSLVTLDWHTLGRGREDAGTTELLSRLKESYARFKVTDRSEEAYFNESVGNLNRMVSLRASRLQDAGSGLVPFMWCILFAGAFAMVSFSYLFGAQNFLTHATMTALLTGVIGLAFYTIVTLDFPFHGLAAITPEAFAKLRLQ
jgi:hypothetical protein